MTVKELKEALANVPDDAEVCYDDYFFTKVKYVEYNEYKNRLIIE